MCLYQMTLEVQSFLAPTAGEIKCGGLSFLASTLLRSEPSSLRLPAVSLCSTVLTDSSIFFESVHLVFTHCSYVVRLIFINLHASEGKENPAKDSILLASSGMTPFQAANSGTAECPSPECLYDSQAQRASNLLELYCRHTTGHWQNTAFSHK